MSRQRAVIITGSSGGIGRALCRTFGAAGHFVIGIDIETGSQKATDAFVQADLSRLCADEAFKAKFFEELEPNLEGKALAAIVNNAAVQVVKPTAELTAADWRQTLDVNVLAAFALSQGLSEELVDAGGSIINIGSIHARLSKPNFVAYATSKAALEGMTRAMAIDLAPDIRVNAISPAAIETEMLTEGFRNNPKGLTALSDCHPAGRIGAPEEIGELAVFLASERAQFMTGSVVSIDGAIGARLHDPA